MTRTLRSKRLREMLFRAHGGKCAICGLELDPNKWEADHIMPWSKVRRTCVHEMQPVCPDCNRLKGSRDV